MEKLVTIALLALHISTIFVISESASSDGNQSKCTRPGYTCQSYKVSQHCQLENDGTYKSTMIEDCTKDGGACWEKTGRCIRPEEVNLKQKDESDYIFKCQQSGMFPHPFDCQKYFVCDKDESGNYVSEDYQCFATYNYIKGKCYDYNCNELIEPCQRLGESGRFGTHPRMYFVCLPSEDASLSPQLFLCPHDQLFIDGECSRPDQGLDEDGLCKGVGNFTIKGNCDRYYSCEAAGEEPKNLPCGCSFWFDPLQKKCTMVSC